MNQNYNQNSNNYGVAPQKTNYSSLNNGANLQDSRSFNNQNNANSSGYSNQTNQVNNFGSDKSNSANGAYNNMSTSQDHFNYQSNSSNPELERVPYDQIPMNMDGSSPVYNSRAEQMSYQKQSSDPYSSRFNNFSRSEPQAPFNYQGDFYPSEQELYRRRIVQNQIAHGYAERPQFDTDFNDQYSNYYQGDNLSSYPNRFDHQDGDSRFDQVSDCDKDHSYDTFSEDKDPFGLNNSTEESIFDNNQSQNSRSRYDDDYGDFNNLDDHEEDINDHYEQSDRSYSTDEDDPLEQKYASDDEDSLNSNLNDFDPLIKIDSQDNKEQKTKAQSEPVENKTPTNAEFNKNIKSMINNLDNSSRSTKGADKKEVGAFSSLQGLLKELESRYGSAIDQNHKITAQEFEQMRRKEAMEVVHGISKEKSSHYNEYIENMLSIINKQVKFNIEHLEVDAHNKEACGLAKAFVDSIMNKGNKDFYPPLLFIVGGAGTGKSVLAGAIAQSFIRNKSKKKLYPKNIKLPFCIIKTYDELKRLWYFNPQETADDYKLREQELYALRNVDLLIIEDFGSSGFGLEAFEQKNFANLLRLRFDNDLPLVITSSSSPKRMRAQMGGYCFDAVCRYEASCAYLTGGSRRKNKLLIDFFKDDEKIKS